MRVIYCGSQSVSARGSLSWSLASPGIVAVFIIVSVYELRSMAKEMLLFTLYFHRCVLTGRVCVCVFVWALIFPRQPVCLLGSLGRFTLSSEPNVKMKGSCLQSVGLFFNVLTAFDAFSQTCWKWTEKKKTGIFQKLWESMIHSLKLWNHILRLHKVFALTLRPSVANKSSGMWNLANQTL